MQHRLQIRYPKAGFIRAVEFSEEVAAWSVLSISSDELLRKQSLRSLRNVELSPMLKDRNNDVAKLSAASMNQPVEVNHNGCKTPPYEQFQVKDKLEIYVCNATNYPEIHCHDKYRMK